MSNLCCLPGRAGGSPGYARNRCPNPCFEMDIVKAHVVSNDRGRVRILRSNEKPPSIGHRSLEVPELDGGREIDGVRPHENLYDARCFAVWLRLFLVPETLASIHDHDLAWRYREAAARQVRMVNQTIAYIGDDFVVPML